MQDTLEFPTIADLAPAPAAPLTPVASAVRAVATIRQAALARFSATEIHLLDMATRYKDVAWDVSTTKGMEACKVVRNELRTQGRYVVQNLVDATKTELNDLKKDIDTEGDRLIAIIAPAETAVDKAIKDREAAVKAERERKAEAERAEAARKAAIQGEIDLILSYVSKASGKGSTAIAAGRAYVDKLTIDEARFAEFADSARAALAEVRTKLAAMHADALAAEEKAAAEAEAVRKAQAVEMAMQQIQGIQQQVIIATAGRLGVRKGGTIECIRDTLAETEAWVIDEENFGAMVSLAQMAKDKAVADIRALLASAEDRAAAEAQAQAASAPLLAFDAAMGNAVAQHRVAAMREDDAPVQVGVDFGAGESATVYVDGEVVDATFDPPANVTTKAAAPAGCAVEVKAIHKIIALASDDAVIGNPPFAGTEPRAAFDAVFFTTPAASASEPVAVEPTIKLGELCAEFGEGFSMTEAYIRNVLDVEGTKAPRGWLYTRSQRNEIIGALLARLEAMPG